MVDYPLGSTTGLRRLHLATRCVAPGADYLAFITRIISTDDGASGLSGWEVVAAGAGIPVDVQLRRCVRAETHREVIQDGIEVGRQLGVSQTPVIFVNHQRFVGAIPLSDLRSLATEVLRP